MAFARPTLPQLIARIQSDIKSRAAGGDAFLRRSFELILSRALAGLSHGLYGYLAWIARQVTPKTADAEMLLLWTAIFGVERKAATKATGSVTFEGTLATTLPSGTIVQRKDGTQYVTTTEGTVSGSPPKVTVAVEAVSAGIAGNTVGAAQVSLVSPISGVSSSGAFTSGGANGGLDIESIEGLRERLLQRVATPARGGNAADYEAWVRATPSVDVLDVWVYPNKSGTGTVGIAFTIDDDNVIPTSDQVGDVQTQISLLHPIDMQSVTAYAPVGQPLMIEMMLEPNTSPVQAAVENAIAEFVLREAEPGGTLLISRLREVISRAAGEENHELTLPIADIASATANHIITFRANNDQTEFTSFEGP